MERMNSLLRHFKTDMYALSQTVQSNEQLTTAFQNYIDNHELPYVKTNMKKAIDLLKGNKEVNNNGEKYYAEFAFEHNIKLNF